MPATVDPKYRREIGQTLRRARKALGLSQTQLGNAVGTSKNAVSSWERGDCAPTVESLREACLVLKVPPGQVLGMSSGTPTVPPSVAGARKAEAAELANELAALKGRAQKAVPDLMGTLKEAERVARRLAK
jgi:transcriptional regulator with XRE-family HTH domain